MQKSKIQKQRRRKIIFRRRRIAATIVLATGIFLVSAYLFDGKTENEQVYAGSKDDNIVNKNNDNSNSKNDDKNVNINDDIKVNKNDDEILTGTNIMQSAREYSVSAKEVNEMIKGKTNGEKEIFLTFDDGPSYNTPKVLSILKKYNVHGTFFTLGQNIESSDVNKKYIKEIYESGNAIANHTYSHDFKRLYPGNSVNPNIFIEELNKTNRAIKNILGENFDTKVMRMPGGYMSREYYKDANLASLDNKLKDKGIVSIDWNADSGDATGNNVADNKIVSKAIKDAGNSEDIILLMHDTGAKDTTVQALPQVIEHFQKNGYTFKVISN